VPSSDLDASCCAALKTPLRAVIFASRENGPVYSHGLPTSLAIVTEQ